MSQPMRYPSSACLLGMAVIQAALIWQRVQTGLTNPRAMPWGGAGLALLLVVLAVLARRWAVAASVAGCAGYLLWLGHALAQRPAHFWADLPLVLAGGLPALVLPGVAIWAAVGARPRQAAGAVGPGADSGASPGVALWVGAVAGAVLAEVALELLLEMSGTRRELPWMPVQTLLTAAAFAVAVVVTTAGLRRRGVANRVLALASLAPTVLAAWLWIALVCNAYRLW